MDTVKGIDVASYQSIPECEAAIKTGQVKFAWVKATQAAYYVNPIFVQQLRLFQRHGIPVGLYHFLEHDVPAKAQWAHYEATIWPYRHSTITAVDDERDSSGKMAPRELVKEFVAEGRGVGFPIGRYASLTTFELGSVGAVFRWVAFWEKNPPNIKWKFWQTKDAVQRIDRNVFAGNEQQLHQFWFNHTWRGNF